MRTVTVEDNRIVIHENGVSIWYPLSMVQIHIKDLVVQLETWREYERLLTSKPPEKTAV